jgi:hypothetical protein
MWREKEKESEISSDCSTSSDNYFQRCKYHEKRSRFDFNMNVQAVKSAAEMASEVTVDFKMRTRQQHNARKKFF